MKVAELLIEYGANISAVDSDGHAPLHAVAQYGIDYILKNPSVNKMENHIILTQVMKS